MSNSRCQQATATCHWQTHLFNRHQICFFPSPPGISSSFRTATSALSMAIPNGVAVHASISTCASILTSGKIRVVALWYVRRPKLDFPTQSDEWIVVEIVHDEGQLENDAEAIKELSTRFLSYVAENIDNDSKPADTNHSASGRFQHFRRSLYTRCLYLQCGTPTRPFLPPTTPLSRTWSIYKASCRPNTSRNHLVRSFRFNPTIPIPNVTPRFFHSSMAALHWRHPSSPSNPYVTTGTSSFIRLLINSPRSTVQVWSTGIKNYVLMVPYLLFLHPPISLPLLLTASTTTLGLTSSSSPSSGTSTIPLIRTARSPAHAPSQLTLSPPPFSA